MSKRTFLAQRYCSENWPQVKGEAPFICTGPAFMQFVIRGSLEKYNEYRFIPSLKSDIVATAADFSDDIAREAVALCLLHEGIVQALWVDDDSPAHLKWLPSVQRLVEEMPKGNLADSVIELLSGMGDPSHYRSYVAEDELRLVPASAASYAFSTLW